MRISKSLNIMWLFVWACCTAENGKAQEIEITAIVRELEEVKIAAKRDGLISKNTARRGTLVNVGQLIAELDNKDLSLKLKVKESELAHAEQKASNRGELQLALAKLERAKKESSLISELGNNAVYLEKYRLANSIAQAQAEHLTASNNLEMHKLQVSIKRNELGVLQNDLRETKVISPVEGIVKKVSKHAGEWVRQGELVMVVTRMDRLIVEGFLDSKVLNPNSLLGAKVEIKIGHGSRAIEITNLLVSQTTPSIELDGKFSVWVEVANRKGLNENEKETWQLRPGMKGAIKIRPTYSLNKRKGNSTKLGSK